MEFVKTHQIGLAAGAGLALTAVGLSRWFSASVETAPEEEAAPQKEWPVKKYPKAEWPVAVPTAELVFALIDADHNGRISKKEFHGWCDANAGHASKFIPNGLARSERSRWRLKADADDDKEIDLTEFVKAFVVHVSGDLTGVWSSGRSIESEEPPATEKVVKKLAIVAACELFAKIDTDGVEHFIAHTSFSLSFSPLFISQSKGASLAGNGTVSGDEYAAWVADPANFAMASKFIPSFDEDDTPNERKMKATRWKAKADDDGDLELTLEEFTTHFVKTVEKSCYAVPEGAWSI